MPDFCETPDFLNTSTILRRASANRVFFNPHNPEHLESLAHFVRTGEWGSTSFHLETPFADVPMTVLMKFAGAQLSVQRETVEERLHRYDTWRAAQAAKDSEAAVN